MSKLIHTCLSLLMISCLAACDSSETNSEQTAQSAETTTKTETTSSAAPATESAPPPSAEAQALLKTALANTSSKISSTHIVAKLKTGKNEIPIEADAGKGTFEAMINRIDGKEAHHIVVGDKSVVSLDGDKTWKPDAEHAGQNMSVMLTFVFNPTAAALASKPVSVIGEDTLADGKATHLRVHEAKGTPVDIWVSEVKGVGPVVSKYQGIVEATDVTLTADIEYTAHNEPVEIKLPS